MEYKKYLEKEPTQIGDIIINEWLPKFSKQKGGAQWLTIRLRQ